jgi:fluoride ion exporter CrcB/FEX
LAASAPLCVTADGVSTSNIAGGVIFADLPANLFGSFIMGLFQNGVVLDLAVPMAIAWLPPQHAFQEMKIIHKAITTGYCGSVTTFSGWNSAMVVQIFGYVRRRHAFLFTDLYYAMCRVMHV